MDWDAYRSQFRSQQSGQSGNRNCVLALGSLNPDSIEISGRAKHVQDIPLIVQNTLANRFTIEMSQELPILSALEVDACFGEASIDFLREPLRFPPGTSWLEASSDESLDQELGLLESVQEIALALARTTPKRNIQCASSD